MLDCIKLLDAANNHHMFKEPMYRSNYLCNNYMNTINKLQKNRKIPQSLGRKGYAFANRILNTLICSITEDANFENPSRH